MSSSLVVASGSLGKKRNISGKPVKLCRAIFNCDQSPRVLTDTCLIQKCMQCAAVAITHSTDAAKESSLVSLLT